jgi:hypothetical protein
MIAVVIATYALIGIVVLFLSLRTVKYINFPDKKYSLQELIGECDPEAVIVVTIWPVVFLAITATLLHLKVVRPFIWEKIKGFTF